jgi:hypothetical protein
MRTCHIRAARVSHMRSDGRATHAATGRSGRDAEATPMGIEDVGYDHVIGEIGNGRDMETKGFAHWEGF